MLKAWNMKKNGKLVDNIETSWKGVQDLCIKEGVLVAVSFHLSNLSVWVYNANGKPTRKNEEKRPIQDEAYIEDVLNNVNHAMNKVNHLSDDGLK